jgi:hypothetical protein
MTPNSNTRIATEERANIVRDMIEHENDVTNHRVTWLLTIQGFLLAALAFAGNDAAGLVPYLCVLGIIGSALTILNVSFSTTAVSRLVEWWNNHSEGYEGPPVIGIGFKPGSILNYLSPSNLFSAALVIAWSIIYYESPDIFAVPPAPKP